MNGRPDGVVTALVIVARAALTNVPGAMQAHVALNGVRLGTIPLDAQWRTNVLSAPGHCWRDANVIALSYPGTYHPCLVGEGYDTARRCAALAVIDAE